jgi:superfamily II DNA or RNA helicase
MSKECTLEIIDEVNIRFIGLDVVTRRKLSDKLKFFIPHAVHTPAYKLGRWDGTVRYCDIGSRSYFHLLDRLIPIVQDAGYYINIKDRREKYDFEFETVDKHSYSHLTWPEGHQMEGEPIVLRDYQVDYINTFLASPQGVSVAPTGSGKTIVTAILSDKISKYGKSLVIVPTKDLVVQTEEDYVNFGLDVGVYYGDRKEFGRQHTICTWQSLDVLNKKSKYYDPEFCFEWLVDGTAGIIVDESHKAKADVLRNLLSRNFGGIPIRWGLTGTIPKEDYQGVAIEAVVGPLIGTIETKELQDKGVLATLNINVLQLQDYASIFTNYQAEHTWLTTDKRRIEFLAEEISTIAETGNTLILVDKIKTGNMLKDLIPGSVFVHGTLKSTDRFKEYNEIKTSDNKVIIATYGVASTGINIVRIFNLVLIEPGKSFVRVIQSIGRGIRVGKDKDHLNVYDITSNAKYSKRHLSKRKAFYKEQKYPFTVRKVKY